MAAVVLDADVGEASKAGRHDEEDGARRPEEEEDEDGQKAERRMLAASPVSRDSLVRHGRPPALQVDSLLG